MESDDDYESFSLHNDSPSPSPKHRRLKRLKKSTLQSPSASELIDLPKLDFARPEALEEEKASDIPRAFDDDSCQPPSEGFDVDDDGDGKEASADFDDTPVDGERKETKRSLQFDDAFDNDCDNGKVKELSNCYDDTLLNSEPKETEEDLELGEDFNDDETEQGVSNGVDETVIRTDRKETKRALDFDDDVNESGPDQTVKIGEDGEKEAGEDVMNDEKKGKKKRLKSSSEDSKAKTSYVSKRREEKERKAHLDQLHVESQRLLRETRGVSFKPEPLVQKPISSILERIRLRKLEMLKKFPQSNTDDSCEEDDHLPSVETEVSDLQEPAKEEKVSNGLNGDPESVNVDMDEPDACGEKEDDVNACSQKELNVEPTPALRAPVDDTQELFDDSQTSDDKESDNDESCEQASSSQEEEEMGPSLLTMKLKFDSAPDDMHENLGQFCSCDEEENDKENVDPHVQEHSSPIGDHAKAFVDDEAEEEDDSDNDRMVFGDDDEDEIEDDIDELNKMIATGYKERPIDLETRNELHQKWLEEKDAAGTDDLLRRLNVASKLREASLLDDEEGEEDVEMNANNNNDDNDEDDGEGEDGDDEDVEKPRVPRVNSKLAKELIAQMFKDKDDDYFSSDDEETENSLVRERLLNKDKEKSRLVSPIGKKDPGEDLGFIKKLKTVPESRKKPSKTSFFDTMLTGGNSNSSSKSSFLNRMSNHSVQISSKQGGSSGAQSFIFGRDDSNSRNSILISEEISNTTTSREVQTKKVTATYKCSQSSQGGSSNHVSKLDSESSSRSFFEILKRSSVQSTVHNRNHDVELSQSVFEAFKIPKKPIKIKGRV